MKTNMLAFILSLIFLTSCYAARIDGPYEGKVVDANTGQPIEGVVVLGTWYREIVTPGGATHKFYDAMETVTDKDGEFRIKGLGLLVASNVIPMNVIIFKAGYEYESGSWSSLKEGLFTENITWDGAKAIIALKKLTLEERKKRGTPPFAAPEERMKLMLKEIYQERREIGLGN